MAVDPETQIWTPDDILWTPAEKGGAREAQFGPVGQYCEELSQVFRRPTRTVTAGPVKFGSEHPIVRQTMGNHVYQRREGHNRSDHALRR